MVREALTALALAVFVSSTLGVLIYLGAERLWSSSFRDRNHTRGMRSTSDGVWVPTSCEVGS
jgi:hypothetical protein